MTARHLRSIDGTGSAQLNLSLDRKKLCSHDGTEYSFSDLAFGWRREIFAEDHSRRVACSSDLPWPRCRRPLSRLGSRSRNLRCLLTRKKNVRSHMINWS